MSFPGDFYAVISQNVDSLAYLSMWKFKIFVFYTARYSLSSFNVCSIHEFEKNSSPRISDQNRKKINFVF